MSLTIPIPEPEEPENHRNEGKQQSNGDDGRKHAGTIDHPAKFSSAVLNMMECWVRQEVQSKGENLILLDPFAGVGKVHSLAWQGVHTLGIEIEPEWARQHEHTVVGDARDLPFSDGDIDIVATSPTYGNRMADKHEARDASKRLTYRHQLGRPLSEGNSGGMQWGDEYRKLHVQAWREVRRVLPYNGLFLLNLSNHIRKGEEIDVCGWHLGVLNRLGFKLVDSIAIGTPRMRFGKNSDVRVACEWLYVLRRQ